jgi:hypothetical protein
MRYIAVTGTILEGGKPLYEGETIELDVIPSFLLGKVTMVEESKTSSKTSSKPIAKSKSQAKRLKVMMKED